ncbi:MAG: 4-alpha-glucanotransferase, partial [Acidobacteria bacterium]|nr:4-alpha-glucanotransferase [Acidobacteriota bacterium]
MGLRPTLHRLARLHGIQAAYTDGCGVRRRASHESILALLRALGAPLASLGPRDLAAATAARRRAMWSRPVEPVLVAWNGRGGDFLLRTPETARGNLARCRLRLEDGRTRSWTIRSGRARVVESATVDGKRYVARRSPLPRRLPDGYHDLHVEIGNRTWSALVVAAPVRAYDDGERSWGAFLPLHAVHSANGWGVGDFTDLDALARWVGARGGRAVGLLPALAAFLGECPFEPSPYLPVTRLFWNELHVDPRRLPEFEQCEPARRLVASRAFRRQVGALRAASLVDYRKAMALRRQVLESLARAIEERPGRG